MPLISAAMDAHFDMRSLPCLAGIVACFFLSLPFGHAADSTRLLVTVNKKTLGRISDKTVGGVAGSRTQTLVVSVTNQSVRAVPAGVIQWTAVLRKSGTGALKYSGKKELPALVSFKSAEVTFGVFDVGTYLSATGVENDKLDYEIVILHDGKETYRTTSLSSFAALAERAELVSNEDRTAGNRGNNQNNQDDQKPKAQTDVKPAEPAIIGAEKMTPQKPEAPVAELAPAAAAPPPVPQQAFDFFNLRGKRPPVAK